MTQFISLSDFDANFSKIFESIIDTINKHVETAVVQIVESSSGILGDSNRDILREFHQMYSGENQVSMQINKSVDELFDQAKAQIEQLGNIVPQSAEQDSFEQQRLGLAAIQKQLETLLTLDARVRDSLMPALMSMQIEDMIKQLTGRLANSLKVLIQEFNLPVFNKETTKIRLREQSVSICELRQFYKSILHEPCPEYLIEAGGKTEAPWS